MNTNVGAIERFVEEHDRKQRHDLQMAGALAPWAARFVYEQAGLRRLRALLLDVRPADSLLRAPLTPNTESV